MQGTEYNQIVDFIQFFLTGFSQLDCRTVTAGCSTHTLFEYHNIALNTPQQNQKTKEKTAWWHFVLFSCDNFVL